MAVACSFWFLVCSLRMVPYMRSAAGILIVLLACLLAFVSFEPASAVDPPNPPQYPAYPGVIHVHTLYSDGSGTFPEIAAAARETGLAYLIATDHNTLEPIRDGHQRYWEDLLVLVGSEVSTSAGHLLALDVPGDFHWSSPQAQTVIDEVNAAGGFSILAHPMSPRWPWQNWNLRGFAGMEIVNLASVMDDDLRSAAHTLQISGRSIQRLATLAQRYLADPDATMFRLTNHTVDVERSQWDDLLRVGRQVVGIGGVDAHARIDLLGNTLRVPSYVEAFESVHTYAVTLAALRREFDHDRRQIYDAYRNGRLYMVYARVAAAPGFRFTAVEGNRYAVMGQPIAVEREVRLTVEAPDHAHPLIRLMRGNLEIAAAEDTRLEWTVTEPGPYRVEVFAADTPQRLFALRRPRVPRLRDVLRTNRDEVRPWIYSNPIYVRR
jgi:hypothetical protein